MRKEEANAKKEALASVNVHVTPIKREEAEALGFKNANSGANGEAFEMDIVMYLCGRVYAKNGIASKGRVDLTKSGRKIEIKSGCGTLDNVAKAEFVIYSPDSTIETARAFTTEMFMDILNACGLVRIKKMSDGSIKKAIQTFKNSKKKETMFRNLLNTYGMDIATFKATI